jgi:hypothetical protein
VEPRSIVHIGFAIAMSVAEVRGFFLPRRLAELAEDDSEVLRAIVGVEAAGVGEDPEARVADRVGLGPDHGLGAVEGDAIRTWSNLEAD